jgi:hypothetical protein
LGRGITEDAAGDTCTHQAQLDVPVDDLLRQEEVLVEILGEAKSGKAGRGAGESRCGERRQLRMQISHHPSKRKGRKVIEQPKNA